MTPTSPDGGKDNAVPFDLARCEFTWGGTRFKVVFAPSADMRRLGETLPPAESMAFVYPNIYGGGLFQVEVRPESLPLDARGVVPLNGHAKQPAECPVVAQ